MKKTEILYGLRLKGQNTILQYNEEHNDDDYCNDTSVELINSNYGDGEWLVDSCEKAKYVKHTDTPWYNSTIEHPQNSFPSDQLEIVKITRVIEVNEEVMEEMPVIQIRPTDEGDCDGALILLSNNPREVKRGEVPEYALSYKVNDFKDKYILAEDYGDHYKIIEIKDLNAKYRQDKQYISGVLYTYFKNAWEIAE